MGAAFSDANEEGIRSYPCERILSISFSFVNALK
jgi:hypothetical protein